MAVNNSGSAVPVRPFPLIARLPAMLPIGRSKQFRRFGPLLEGLGIKDYQSISVPSKLINLPESLGADLFIRSNNAFAVTSGE
jgi:hypothetical protein